MSPNRRHYAKRLNRRTCEGCGKRFDNGGWRYVKHCDICYETRATPPSEECCYACLTKPLGYTCPRRRCQCPQHADMSTLLDACNVVR
jgi:hypothetical protein